MKIMCFRNRQKISQPHQSVRSYHSTVDQDRKRALLTVVNQRINDLFSN